jgi:hypothetical protein
MSHVPFHTGICLGFFPVFVVFDPKNRFCVFSSIFDVFLRFFEVPNGEIKIDNLVFFADFLEKKERAFYTCFLRFLVKIGTFYEKKERTFYTYFEKVDKFS